MEHDMDIQKEIIAIQTKLAYLEDFVNQLQVVAVGHTEAIALLQQENKLLAQKIRDMAEDLAEDIPNRRPPHY